MTNRVPSPPRKLDDSDILREFESGSRELDAWLGRFAFTEQRANSATTFVSCINNLVIGFYTLTVGAVERQAAPAVLSKSSSAPVPCIVLARLAVDRMWQQKGIGTGLLTDALERSAKISGPVAARAVVIHARDAEAKSFFASRLNYQTSPLDELQIMISMKALKKLFRVD